MKSFGEKLVKIREEKNISQKKLAEELGITPTRLNYWEKDKRKPDIDMIRKIAKSLKVDPNMLLGWDEIDEEFLPQVQTELNFIPYLESLGYSVDSEVSKWHYEDVVENGAVIGQGQVEDERCIIVSSKDSTIKATFTQEEFKALQQQSRANIDGAILLQSQRNKKEPPPGSSGSGSESN